MEEARFLCSKNKVEGGHGGEGDSLGKSSVWSTGEGKVISGEMVVLGSGCSEFKNMRASGSNSKLRV